MEARAAKHHSAPQTHPEQITSRKAAKIAKNYSQPNSSQITQSVTPETTEQITSRRSASALRDYGVTQGAETLRVAANPNSVHLPVSTYDICYHVTTGLWAKPKVCIQPTGNIENSFSYFPFD